MIKTDENGLSERQKKALPHIIGAKTEIEGCRQAEISPQTYYEWLKEPAFKAELAKQRNMVIESAIDGLKACATKAVDTLVKLLDSESHAIQRGVANDILNHIARFKELKELEDRVRLIEEKQGLQN